MAETFTIEVVTPERAVLTGQAEQVVLPGTNGQMGILPGHLPLLSSLDLGELVIQGFSADVGDEGHRKYFIEGGFVEVLPNKVIVMTEFCEGLTEIDIEAAQAAIEEAEKELLAMEEKAKAEEIEQDIYEVHQQALRRARMQLLLADEDED